MKSKKIFALVVAVFTLTALVLAVAATLFLQDKFNKIETSAVQNDVTRAANILEAQVDALGVQAGDWASWDDTYAFVQDHNDSYIESNLTNAAIQNLQLHFMLFVDTQGKIVETRGVDRETGEDLQVPDALLQAFSAQSSLLSKSENSLHAGYLGIDEHIALFSAKPILTSLGEGPYKGTLVFVKYLLPAEVNKLAKSASLSLSYQKISSNTVTPDVKQIASSLKGDETLTQVLPHAKIAGYRLLKDARDEPLLIARVESSRTTYLKAQYALVYYLVALVGVVVIASVTSIYATRQMMAKDKIIKLKDEFFSMASHEIRTPLAAIRGNSQMLQQIYGPANDADFNQMTNDIHTSSERLIRIVTNFLDLARLEENRIPLRLESFDVHEVADAVVKEMQGIATERKIDIRTEFKGKLPPVWADKDRIKQVLYNLVGNSLKFTEEGSITISARDDLDHIIVSVTDTGRGISLEGQKALFKKFQQTKQYDAYKGSGLGLYISKMLIEKMGGTIILESSEEGKGTTISFTLPKFTTQSKSTVSEMATKEKGNS